MVIFLLCWLLFLNIMLLRSRSVSVCIWSLFSLLFRTPSYEYAIIYLFILQLLAVLNHALSTFECMNPNEHRQAFLWGLCVGMK